MIEIQRVDVFQHIDTNDCIQSQICRSTIYTSFGRIRLIIHRHSD